MSDIVIRVENLSKQYRIGLREEVRDTFVGAITSVLRNPLRKLRNLRRLSVFEERDEVAEDVLWALKDVAFEVQRGEVLGIIGRNGAGKSTLLRILSKITYPTSGRIEMFGRVASLLEVGTGFHPELTGRENIYLNGTLLGMTKKEIDRKLDEIVDFSGVVKFIDTPVKRYSSGMRVRLGFSVAAFLESEILLIDEVLAVGDAEFQKKSLGKMDEVAKQGRTVLFVSHNLASITALCTQGYLMELGEGKFFNSPIEAVNEYLGRLSHSEAVPLDERPNRAGNGKLRFVSINVQNEQGESVRQVITGQDICIALEYDVIEGEPLKGLNFGLVVLGNFGQHIFYCETSVVDHLMEALPGRGIIYCEIPKMPLSPGEYNILVWAISNFDLLDRVENAATFSVHAGDFFGTGKLPFIESQAVLVPHSWRV